LYYNGPVSGTGSGDVAYEVGMSKNTPVVITTKQAKNQINHFGRSLVLYIAVFMAVNYGVPFIASHYPAVLNGIDVDLLRLCLSIILMIVITVIPFNISAHALDLNISEYLKNPRLRADRVVALICIGIGLNLVVTSISTLFYFFFHTQSISYSFLGSFRTTDQIIKNILYLLHFVLIKPVCDEYIFRGIIQRQLGHYGRYFGVLGSAALYAISQPNLVDAVPAFFVGWYLSLITLRYHSIRPSVQVHIALCLFLWALDVIPGNYLWLITVFIIVIYILAGLFLFQKRVDTGLVRYGATEWKLWRILLTSGSIIVCMVLFAINVFLSLRG